MTHEYTEFGVTTKILEYKPIGNELKGMRSGKPFVMDWKVHINFEGKLHIVEEMEFYDTEGNVLNRSQLRLDTTTKLEWLRGWKMQKKLRTSYLEV